MLELTSLRGGTEAPAVPRAVFAVGEDAALRYDRPAAAIADFVTGYHLYATHGPSRMGQVDWFLPGTASVRVLLDAGPVSVRIRRREFAPVPEVALYGPTSHALRAVTNGGVMIGFGVSALGWARMFPKPAYLNHNLIRPLADLTGPALPGALLDALRAVPDEHALKATLDAFLAPLLGPPHPDEPLIRAMTALLLDPAVDQVAEVVDRLGADQATVRRMALRYFGMSTKPLLRRARFLRSFLRMFRVEGAPGYADIDPGYHDASHFLRDAGYFLGMTPRRFMAMPTPFLDASIRARAAVLGSATQALHDVDDAPARSGG